MSLQSKILTYIKTQSNTWAVKVIACNKGGCPDILVCHNGRFIAIESKDSTKPAEPRQIAQMHLITHKAKGRAIVARSLDDVKVLFRKKGHVPCPKLTK